MSQPWSPAQAPDQSGRTAIVTGANTGLGFQTALAFASKGAHTILACRNADKAAAAKAAIEKHHPDAQVEVRLLDTGDMDSVRAFAEAFQRDHGRLDLLINNAGAMMTPYRAPEEGFEEQLAVNYLGHFLLTGLLLPTLTCTPEARVVTLYSLAHRWGGIQFDDWLFTKKYHSGKAYIQSKMACLMFALELNERLRRAGHDLRSIAAHPGVSQSDLNRNLAAPFRLLTTLAGPFFYQSAEQGAWPTLYAALSDDLKGGESVGPSGRGQRKGPPTVVDVTADALDGAQRQRLWKMTEELLGFRYDLAAAGQGAEWRV